jgi:Lysylphosphatidylglycerol synthase TM region
MVVAGIDAAWRAAHQAYDLIAGQAAHINLWWLALGLLLHITATAVRQPGWLAILRAAHPDDTKLRLRDVEGAFFAGSGLNGVLPARGGDVVKLYLLHRRIDKSSYATLAGTLVPETLFETACGIALVIWAATLGFIPIPTSTAELPSLDVSFVVAHPFLSVLIVGVTAALIGMLGVKLSGSARRFVARVRQGLAILSTPRDYFVKVVPWQALGRVIRFGSLACFMAAFALPVTIQTVLLVMAAYGGTRIIPIAPASTGLRIVLLTYGLVELTDVPIDAAQVSTFCFGIGAVQLISGLLISVGILGATLGSVSPRDALRKAKAAFAPLTPDSERAP